MESVGYFWLKLGRLSEAYIFNRCEILQGMTDSTELVEKKAVRGIWVMASSNALWQLVSWLLTVFTVRYLTPADYGLMAIVGSITPYLALAAALNLIGWIIRVDRFDESEEATGFTLCVITGTVASVLCLAGAPVLGYFYANPLIISPLYLIAPSFFARALITFLEGKLRREMRFGAISAINLTSSMFTAVLQLLLAMYGAGYWALVIGLVTKEFVTAVLMVRVARLPERLCPSKSVLLDAVMFCVPAAVSTALWVFYSTVDDIFVGRAFGTHVLGFYSMAYFLMEMPNSKISAIVLPVIQPYFARIKSDTVRLRKAYFSTVETICLVVFPITIGIGLVAEEAIPLLLGEHWGELIPPLIVMIYVGLFRALSLPAPSLKNALGKPSYSLYPNIFGFVVFPVLVVILGTLYGVSGVYAAWIIFLPLQQLLVFYLIDRLLDCGLVIFLRTVFVPAVSASLMAVSLFTLGEIIAPSIDLYLVLALKIMTGGVIYCLSVYLLKGAKILIQLRSFGIQS